MTGSELRTVERAANRRALRQPQPFPLTCDGAAMESVWNRQSFMVLVNRCDLAPAIVEARYLDWLTAELRRRLTEQVACALAAAANRRAAP